ncbi:chitin disaccharide deacetylase [Bacillus haynesii]|uniref:chitin disaccharide deacetylase n=1 Tax=Bacillus haynesii TaxID=1925021 RepID=UPI00228133AD|nr:chitin disaccharide deacetylase [Bacillus haynesii]MCY8265542.1 chitin disaccharide deacetylase [Bacillus haynesii]MCY8356102.1 chitin disaccharide deacetylase [Bacillus haynesii]MCY8554989.1 chitin disaccharide deacetylase [Bacillus haynesii]
MKKLIINADDFGYSRGVNYGIIDAYKLGILTSATFMTNMPGSGHAVRLARESPGLGIGVHLVLTCGRPLLSDHRTIVDAKGNFRNLAFYQGAFTIDADEVYREWKAQIETSVNMGLEPDHLDSHHHINAYPDISDVFLTLAKEYRLPVRRNMESAVITEKGVKTTDSFSPVLEAALKDEEAVSELFEENNTVEVMTHPAYLDKELLANSSYTYPRVDELEFLTDPDVVIRLNKLADVQLVSFRNLI